MSRTTRINGGPPEAHVNTQSFYLQPEKRTTGLKHDYHIFFITGNPGLISYYHTFLDYLSKLLGENRRISSGVYVYGYSLGGFLPVDESNDVPYGLQQQVEYVEEKLQNYVQLQNQDPADQRGKHQKPPKIILIGHSVGAYILLELIRRHRMRVSPEKNEDMDIVGGILLFPTVTHIAKSPSGMKFSWLLKIPHFALLIGTLVRLLTFFIPKMIIRSLVKLVTGFPTDAAETTTAFIKSPMGVRQALHMARDEMNEITEDRWDEEIWDASASDPKTAQAKLIFYFGKDDHWVAEHTRDELIQSRAFREERPDETRPKMVIDEDGIPHGFCIRHSEVVAKKVEAFVQDIIEKSS